LGKRQSGKAGQPLQGIGFAQFWSWLLRKLNPPKPTTKASDPFRAQSRKNSRRLVRCCVTNIFIRSPLKSSASAQSFVNQELVPEFQDTVRTSRRAGFLCFAED
jgi:hypothetical protein